MHLGGFDVVVEVVTEMAQCRNRRRRLRPCKERPRSTVRRLSGAEFNGRNGTPRRTRLRPCTHRPGQLGSERRADRRKVEGEQEERGERRLEIGDWREERREERR